VVQSSLPHGTPCKIHGSVNVQQKCTY